MTARCDLTDLPVNGCGHCRGITDDPEAAVDDVTVRITASHAGRCASCGAPFEAGVRIGWSSDAGGWVAPCCDGGEK